MAYEDNDPLDNDTTENYLRKATPEDNYPRNITPPPPVH